MPSYVIKPDPGLNRYVYWSTITESPEFFGDRMAMQSYLEQWQLVGDGHRIDRADEFGTSCVATDMGPKVWRFFAWDETEFIFEQRGQVSREDVWELCRRLDAGLAVSDLIRPFEDDE